MTERILSVLVEDKPGVLARVSSTIARRGFNIKSLSVGPTSVEGRSKMTIVTDASAVEQVKKQINKLINVIKIVEPTNEVQAKGTTIHTALELLYDEPAENRTKDKLHNIFRTEWNNIRNNDEFTNLFTSKEEERAWGLDAYKLLTNYLQLENPKD